MALLSRERRGEGGVRVAVLLPALLAACGLFGAPAAPVSEYRVKAGYLYNFTRYVDWPAGAFADPSAPLVIGVLGNDPFGKELDATVEGRSSQGRRVIVRRTQRVEDLAGCHVVFISASELGRLAVILAALKRTSALTVCDAQAVFERGVMIKLILVQSTVQFDVQLRPATEAGLRISSRMLDAARLVLTRAAAPLE